VIPLLGGSPIPLPGGTMLIAGVMIFLVVAVAAGGAVVWYQRQNSGDPWDAFAAATAAIVDDEDADAIAFIPYSDGPLIPKPAIYDRELLGGKGGYKTPDGERIYVDGQGNGKFSLQGVDVVLAMDPTEHAAAVDPLKAWIAHQLETGKWVTYDRKGNLIEAGEALMSLDGETPAMDMDPSAARAAATDGGYPSEVHKQAADMGLDFDEDGLEQAKAALEEAGALHKIVDVAPPSEAVVDAETGEVEIEEATHVAVDVSKASDLLPKKTNTTAWQTMEEKARQEGMDAEKLQEKLVYGIIIGATITGIMSAVALVIMLFM